MWEYKSIYDISSDELYHYGIKGQKWGVRRYQNEDGTLTAAGKKRVQKQTAKIEKMHSKYTKEFDTANDYRSKSREYDKRREEIDTNNKVKDMYLKRSLKADSEVALSRASVYDDLARQYRDRSKQLIDKVNKIDPKLGEKLSKKYSSMLDKTFLGDFTLSELKAIQKNPDNLTDKAKKYIEQEMDRTMSTKQLKAEIQKRYAEDSASMQRMLFQQQMMMQQQIEMQIQFDIQNQIHQQMTYQSMGMM